MLTKYFPHTTTITLEQAVAKPGIEVAYGILAAAIADPDDIHQFANDISHPAELVQGYLIEVDTRRALFNELQAIC